MRRRTRSQLRVALVVLVVALLVVEARYLRVKASHNVTLCFAQLDDAGRQLSVHHVALRELVEDPKVSPSWIHEEALRELAFHALRWIVHLEAWRRGEVPLADVVTTVPWLAHSAQIVRICGLLPEDRALAIAAEEQDLAECGVPEPVTVDGARRWYHEVVAKRLAEFDKEPVILGRSSSAPPPAYDKALAARERSLRATFQPTRRPLR